jgi:hypothetical protein
MKVKRLPIILVFIFLVSIVSVHYYHGENRNFQDDSFIVDTVDVNSDFSTSDTNQFFLSTQFIFIIIIYKNLFTPRISTCKFFTRAPPE